ncbi:glycosyltransferase family 2 protein, partial [Conservatibacter flavescens]
YDITFIVPVYNTAKYLAQCLDSIIQQDINKEIIVINDGSTDDSANILTRYANRFPFIRVITQENRGVSHARNKGIHLATGRYIYFIDSDDYLVGQLHFREYIEAMKQHNAVILKGAAMWEKEEAIFAQALPKVKATATAIYQDCIKCAHYMEVTSSLIYIDALVQHHFAVELWTHIYCTNYLRTHNIVFDEKLTHAEDVLFVIQALTRQECTIIETSELFYFYRWRHNSAVNLSNTSTTFCAFLDTKNAILRYLLQHDFPPTIRANIALLGLICLTNAFHSYLSFDEETKQEVDEKLTLELFGLLQLYEALNIAQRNHHNPLFEEIKKVFRRKLVNPPNA